MAGLSDCVLVASKSLYMSPIASGYSPRGVHLLWYSADLARLRARSEGMGCLEQKRTLQTFGRHYQRIGHP